MKKLLPLFILLTLGSFLFPSAHAMPTNAGVSSKRAPSKMQALMRRFGSLVASIEILRYKEKKPDWEAIDLTLKEMDATLSSMQAADKVKAYQDFTTLLESNLKEVKGFSQRRNESDMYEAFDQMTHTCFQCHAEYRRPDFLVPKNKAPAEQPEKPISQLWFPQDGAGISL